MPVTERSRAFRLGAGRADELDRAELLGATDERRLDRLAAADAPELAEDAERAPRRDGLFLALQREVADLAERHVGRSPRTVVSPTRTVPGSAIDWSREAVFTRSPATIPARSHRPSRRPRR